MLGMVVTPPVIYITYNDLPLSLPLPHNVLYARKKVQFNSTLPHAIIYVLFEHLYDLVPLFHQGMVNVLFEQY